MESPFENDIFALIWQAFKNLYPEKECRCLWEPNIRDAEDGMECWGVTDFGEDGTVMVFVKPTMHVTDAAEILAHELAHVAVGLGHDHDESWEQAFDDIFNEYNRIGDELYDKHDAIFVTSGKDYVREE